MYRWAICENCQLCVCLELKLYELGDEDLGLNSRTGGLEQRPGTL